MGPPGLASVSRRLLVFGGLIAVFGAGVLAAIYGLRAALSFAAGGALAAVNLVWLQASVGRLLPAAGTASERSARRSVAGFLARLLLILLALYAIIRLHFLSAPAVVTGFAAFHCSIFIEGMLEALGSPPRT